MEILSIKFIDYSKAFDIINHRKLIYKEFVSEKKSLQSIKFIKISKYQ
jgi:hypothetical protein